MSPPFLWLIKEDTAFITLELLPRRNKENELKKDGTYNVKIRMTHNREVKRLSTNIFVRPCDLTKSFKLKNPQFIKEADALVRQYQEICATLPLEASNYGIDEILEFIKTAQEKNRSIDFIQFCKEWLEQTEIKGKKMLTFRRPARYQ